MGRRRVITTVVGVVSALCVAAFWAASTSASPGPAVRPMAYTPSTLTGRQVTHRGHQIPPRPEAMHALTSQRYGWVQDRADWVDGAVVHCDLGTSLAGRMLLLDEHAAIDGDSAIDVPMRHGGKWPLSLGLEDAHFAVTEAQGSAVARLVPSPFRAPSTAEEQVFVVSWSGAEPGSTVPCDAVHDAQIGHVRIQVLEADGTPYEGDVLGWHDALVRVRGCGLWRRAARLGQSVPLPVGACTLQAEIRGDVPFASALGPPTTVVVQPGQHTQVVVRLPHDPPLSAPPDIEELDHTVDFLLFEGREQLANLGERAIDATLDGTWHAELAGEIADEVQRLVDEQDAP